MTLESIEPLALVRTAVRHLLVRDRDASIRGHAVANARPPPCGSAPGPGSASAQGLDRLLQGRLCELVEQLAFEPRLQRVELPRYSLHRVGLLDCSFQSMSSARLMLDAMSRGMPASRHTCSLVHPSRPAAQLTTWRAACASKLKVLRRVPRPPGTRIDRYAQGLRQLAGIERLGGCRQFHRAFQDAPIQVGGDRRSRNVCNPPCEKGGCSAPRHPSPSARANRRLSTQSSRRRKRPGTLDERRHGHHRGRTRLFPRPRRAGHRRQLVLKRVIEQLVPMELQKPEELRTRSQRFSTPALASSGRQAVSNAQSSSACLRGPTARERIRARGADLVHTMM